MSVNSPAELLRVVSVVYSYCSLLHAQGVGVLFLCEMRQSCKRAAYKLEEPVNLLLYEEVTAL